MTAWEPIEKKNSLPVDNLSLDIDSSVLNSYTDMRLLLLQAAVMYSVYIIMYQHCYIVSYICYSSVQYNSHPFCHENCIAFYGLVCVF